MMFAQANSEHCRHKIFNADWVIDGVSSEESLFSFIKNTHKVSPEKTLSAYKDNAAVIEGNVGPRCYPDSKTKIYAEKEELINFVTKVETHNHPTELNRNRSVVLPCRDKNMRRVYLDVFLRSFLQEIVV